MNTKTLAQERAEAHSAKLDTERAEWFNRIQTAAEAAGLTVKKVNNRCGTAQFPEGKFDCAFIIEAFCPRTSYTSLKTYNRVVIGSYGHKSIWRKLDDKALAAVVAELKGRIELDRKTHESRERSNDMARTFKARADAELAGVYAPPGITPKIVMGNSDDAGKYVLEVCEHSSVLRGPWTLEQLKVILAAIDSVTGGHQFRIGRRVTVENGDLFLGDGPHQGVIASASTNYVTVRVPNPDTSGKTLWQHHDLNVAVTEPSLKIVS